MKYTSIVPILFALLLALPSPLKAQQRKGDAWRPPFTEQQFAVSLQSGTGAIQMQTLKNAVVWSAVYRDRYDLRMAVGPIITYYESQTDDAHRLMALAALQGIGSRKSLAYLERHVTEAQYDQVRRLTSTVLSEYFTLKAAPAI